MNNNCPDLDQQQLSIQGNLLCISNGNCTPLPCSENPTCYYKLVEAEIPFPLEGGDGILRHPYYSQDDPSTAAFDPIVQRGITLQPHTSDKCVSAVVRALDGQLIDGSPGPSNWYHSSYSNPTVPNRQWSFEFMAHKCCIITKVYIRGSDVDVSEFYDTTAFTGAGWVNHPLNTVPGAPGGVYTGAAANQTFILEWDVIANGGLPPVETISSGSPVIGSSIFVYLADYYVPLKTEIACDGTLTHYDDNGVFGGPVFEASSIGGQCCNDVGDPIFPVAAPDCVSKTVYSWATTPGVREQIWSGAGNAAPHDFASVIFSGPAEGSCGLPAHINGAADVDIVVPDWVDNTANDPSNGSDQFRWSGWIYIDQDGTQLQDINGNSGERLRIWLDGVVVFNSTGDTTGGTPGAGIFATVDYGWHYLVFEGSDLSAFAGVQLQNDNGGDNVFSNFSGPTSVDEPVQICRQEKCGYVLLAGETECPQKSVGPCRSIIPAAGSSSGTTQVDRSSIATADVSGDSNQPNLIQTLTQTRADTGLTIAANTVTNNIGGDYVEIHAQEYFQQPQSGLFARINPELELLKNGAVVATSASGYQRHATQHRSSSNSISWVDPNPTIGDTYQLRSQQGSQQDDVMLIDLGTMSVKVVEKVTVLTP